MGTLAQRDKPDLDLGSGNQCLPLFTINNAGITKTNQINIATTATGPQGPTGQVNNNSGSTTAFLVNPPPTPANPNPSPVAASFIFANLNGTISAWNNALGFAPSSSQIKVTTPGAVYTGLAIGSVGSAPFLYAANNSQQKIDVFDGTFANVTLTPAFLGKFVTPLVLPRSGSCHSTCRILAPTYT